MWLMQKDENMEQIIIHTYFHTADALKLGRNVAGDGEYKPTTEELAELSETERAELAEHCWTGTSYAGKRALVVTGDDWSAIVQSLQAEVAKKQQEHAERARVIENAAAPRRLLVAENGPYYVAGTMPPKKTEQFETLPYLPGFSNSELNDLEQRVREQAEDERRRLIMEADAKLEYDVVNGELAPPIKHVLDACRSLGNRFQYDPFPERAVSFRQRLEDESTKAQKERELQTQHQLGDLIRRIGSNWDIERFEAGVFPDSELNELVSNHLFKTMDSFDRYDEISEQEVAQELDCDVDDVRFASHELEHPTLSQEEWIRLKRLKAEVESPVFWSNATVEIREHVGYDQNHDRLSDPDVRKRSVRVSIPFAGKTYRRLFAL